MIFLLLSSVYAADVSFAEEKQSFFDRLALATSSVRSHLPSIQTTVKAAAAVGCTALYFMQNSSSNQDQSPYFTPSFNGTSMQLVQFQTPVARNGFDQMACLAIAGLASTFTGTVSSLLMGTSCLATGAAAERHVEDSKSTELTSIPFGNCTYYYNYLETNPIAFSFLEGIPCTTGIIDLSNKHLGIADITALEPALQQLNLDTLLLDNNDLGAIGINILVPALQYLDPDTFSINNNRIGITGIKILAPILKQWAYYCTLGLGGNEIGDEGIASLVNVLDPYECYGRTFNFRNNKIGDKGIMAIVDDQFFITHFSSLDLSMNNMSSRSAMVFATALMVNGRAFFLNISYNNLTSTECEKFQSIVGQANQRAQIICSP